MQDPTPRKPYGPAARIIALLVALMVIIGTIFVVFQPAGGSDAALLPTAYAAATEKPWKDLKKGGSGESVRLSQQALSALGYYDGKIDGSYSSAVVEAVGMFQTANCLTKTGSADRETREKMYCTKVVTYKAFLSSNPADLVSCSASSRTQKIEKLIAVAQSKLGCKYVLNSKGPNTFDCSNFTKFCFNAVGVSISGAVIKQGYMTGYTKITDPSQLQRGDLLIFDTVKDDDDLSDHAGIYLGDGTFIHCSSTRGMVVISNFKTYGNFSWGFRLL